MKIECKNKITFLSNVRIEKSNAWIINCELCTIDLPVWGFALIFDFLIISFCSVSTRRIKIFTQVRWSLQLNVNTTTLIDSLFDKILIVRVQLIIIYIYKLNFFIFLNGIFYGEWYCQNELHLCDVNWMSKTWNKQLRPKQSIYFNRACSHRTNLKINLILPSYSYTVVIIPEWNPGLYKWCRCALEYIANITS